MPTSVTWLAGRHGVITAAYRVAKFWQQAREFATSLPTTTGICPMPALRFSLPHETRLVESTARIPSAGIISRGWARDPQR